MSKYSNIDNNEKNRNTNNNCNNNDSVRFLMTKTLIIVIMEELVKELVIKTMITVAKLFYRNNSMEKKKSKQTNKLDLMKKLFR